MKRPAGIVLIVACIAGLVGALNCMPLHPHGTVVEPRASPASRDAIPLTTMRARTLARLESDEQADRVILANPRATAEQKRLARENYEYKEIDRRGVETPNQDMPLRDIFQNPSRQPLSDPEPVWTLPDDGKKRRIPPSP